MKVKLSDIVQVNEEGGVVLTEGLKKLFETKLPLKIGYVLGKLINSLQTDVNVFAESRTKLVKELGEAAPDAILINDVPNKYIVKPENLSKFQEEVIKLSEIEIEIDWKKIKIEDLGDISIEPKFIPQFLFE